MASVFKANVKLLQIKVIIMAIINKYSKYFSRKHYYGGSEY